MGDRGRPAPRVRSRRGGRSARPLNSAATAPMPGCRPAPPPSSPRSTPNSPRCLTPCAPRGTRPAGTPHQQASTDRSASRCQAPHHAANYTRHHRLPGSVRHTPGDTALTGTWFRSRIRAAVGRESRRHFRNFVIANLYPVVVAGSRSDCVNFSTEIGNHSALRYLYTRSSDSGIREQRHRIHEQHRRNS